MLLRKPSFYLAILGIAAATRLVIGLQKSPPAPPPLAPPARSPFDNTVAATGLIEASAENVRIAPPKPGLVTRIHVRVGQTVAAGDPLFQLDDREARARVATLDKQMDALAASIAPERVQVADWTDQLARITRLERDKVATEDERKRREFTLATAQARVESLEAQVAALRQQAAQARVELEILTVRAPRNGTLLQVNLREGEYATANATTEALMLLGDLGKLQIRAEVDEQNAPLIPHGAKATASLKGNPSLRMPLSFVRTEPFVVPKRNLTGDSVERVDTRVLQVVFELPRPAFPVYVGQQVDVFIERMPPEPQPASAAPTTAR